MSDLYDKECYALMQEFIREEPRPVERGYRGKVMLEE